VISVGSSSGGKNCASIAGSLGGTRREITEREIGVTKAILVDLATAKMGGEAQSTIGSTGALRGVESGHIEVARGFSLLTGVGWAEGVD